MPSTPAKVPSMSRQSTNLSKASSRQTPRRTPGQTKRKVDLSDQEYDKAMEKQLSSLEKKSTRTSSMGGTMPRLGVPDAPKLGTPAKPEEPEPTELGTPAEPEPTEGDTQKQGEETSEKDEKRGEAREEVAEQVSAADEDSDDEISRVRDENNKFVQQKFEAELKTLLEASELPSIEDVDFTKHLENQQEALKERAERHSDWMTKFVSKKESILYRLGVISKSRNNRFTEVCNISCRLLDAAPFSSDFPKDSSNSRSSSRSKVVEEERSQSTEHSQDIPRDSPQDAPDEISKAKSRKPSAEKVSTKNSDLLPDIVDIKEDIFSVANEEVSTVS